MKINSRVKELVLQSGLDTEETDISTQIQKFAELIIEDIQQTQLRLLNDLDNIKVWSYDDKQWINARKTQCQLMIAEIRQRYLL